MRKLSACVRIEEEQAARLLAEVGNGCDPEDVGYVKEVNPISVGVGVHLTYLRADQSPEKREGFHLTWHVPQ